MEKLHRASDGAAVTLSGQRGIILRSSAKIQHKVVGPDGKAHVIAVDSFSYHPSVSSDKVTLIWNNEKGVVVVDRGIADFLLLRRWAKEVSNEALEWWNEQVAAIEEASKEPEAPVPTPPPTEPPAPTPVPEPVKEEPKQEAPKAKVEEAPKPAAIKPAATKEEALKRAEEEAARLAGAGEKKPVTD